jgi:hypothetical protein
LGGFTPPFGDGGISPPLPSQRSDGGIKPPLRRSEEPS